MDIKNIFNTLFAYKPPVDYNFSLPEDPEAITKNSTQANQGSQNKETQNKKHDNIFPSLNVNLEYMKTRYNLLINSDVIMREFTINARGKQYNAFLVYLDGMVDLSYNP